MYIKFHHFSVVNLYVSSPRSTIYRERESLKFKFKERHPLIYLFKSYFELYNTIVTQSIFIGVPK